MTSSVTVVPSAIQSTLIPATLSARPVYQGLHLQCALMIRLVPVKRLGYISTFYLERCTGGRPMHERITADVIAGHALIADVIDTDQEDGMMVAHGISERLDALKAAYHGLPDFLTRVVEAELARVPRELSDALRHQLWSVVYMPLVHDISSPFTKSTCNVDKERTDTLLCKRR